MIFIVDGNNLAFSSNMVMRLHTKDDFPTQAIKGFFNSLQSYARLFNPTQIFVAWDGGKSKNRMEICPEYKANRAKEKTPQEQMDFEEFLIQIPEIQRGVFLLGAYNCRGWGIEGDDIIAVVAKMAVKSKKEAIIFSSDADFYQLINEYVSVYSINTLVKGERHTTLKNMETLRGLPPHQWLEYKALLGDKSDNIVGVNGVGEKTAMDFMKKFGNIQNFIDDQNSDSPTKVGARVKRILENKDLIERNIKMMDLNHPAGDLSGVKMLRRKTDPNALKAFFKKYELKSFYLNFPTWISHFNKIVEAA